MPRITDKTPTGIDQATIRVMAEGYQYNMGRADSGMGDVFRPGRHPSYGQWSANLETLYDFFINNVPDPDTALEQNPDFDEILRQDPDVHYCMNIRELTVASMPWRIEAPEESDDKPRAELGRKYCLEVFKGVPRLQEVIRQMQNAVLMGGQGHEWLWRMQDNYPRPVQAEPVHKTRFTYDRLGNMALLTRLEPVWGAYVAVNPKAKFEGDRMATYFPPGKFTYHQHTSGVGGTWSRPAGEGYKYYGRGEDVSLYIPVMFGQFALRFWMKYMEKFGMPWTVLYYPENNPTTSQINKIADSARGDTVITIPRQANKPAKDWWDLELVQPTGTGYQIFQEFLNDWKRPRIEKILLGGSDLMEHGDSGGFSASVSQKDFGPMMVYRFDGRCIGETFSSQLIPAILRARWPDYPVELMPRFVLEPKEEVDRQMQVDILTTTAEAVAVREQDFYDAAGVKAPADGDKTVFLGGSASDEFGIGDFSPGKRQNKPKAGGRINGGELRKPVGSKNGSSVARGNGRGNNGKH